MTDYVWKHLPYAIYLDTNVLRSAGPNLDAPWINELLSITNKYKISVCISELVLEEWCEHIYPVLEGHKQKILSSSSFLNHYDIHVPDINYQQIIIPSKDRLVELVSRMMKDAGFTVVKNCDVPLSRLLAEAVAKRPPFEQGGKGLCDTVIIETYAEHAKMELSNGSRVLVISKDGAVKRSEGRFKDRGVSVEFIGESEIVGRIMSLLDSEKAEYLDHKKSRLREYIQSNEPIILDFVKKNPIKITDWLLDNPMVEHQDRISGTIEKILSIRPVHIIDVIGGTPTYGEQTAQDRYPVRVSVEIELDIVIRELGVGLGLLGRTRAIVQPDMIDDNSPVTLENTLDWKSREYNKTIKRDISVLVTLDAEKDKKGTLSGFRIEKII